MEYQFNKYVDRLNTACIKWDFQQEDFGTNGLLPFWIADSDFEVLPNIRKALIDRIYHPIYGYSDADEEYFNAVIHWFATRHNWEITRDMIIPTSGVVPSIAFAIEAFTDVGDGVMVQSPVYDPFYTIINKNNRKLVINNLVCKDGRYEMNFDDMEEKMSMGVKMLILCSPHNPVGRVWKHDELEQVAKLCRKYNVMIVSDEIHCDLILTGNKHISMGLLEEVQDQLIVCTAASKAFNLAGLQTANIIIPNPNIKDRYWETLLSKFWLGPNLLGLTATKAAYQHGAHWLDQQVQYLNDNVEFTKAYIQQYIPKLKVTNMEGTYLMWIDFAELGFTSNELTALLVERGIALNNGSHYGINGEGYMRLNVACPRNLLEQGLGIIKEFVSSFQ